MTFVEYIIYIFNLGVVMGAVLAFIIIVWSGINLLNAGGNPSAIQESKKKIINALLGLAILLVSYVLLTTINPDLVNIKNISLGTVNINIPIISPIVNPVTIPTYTFKEIPIGTLTENVLAGTSSNSNKMPCYQYEHRYKNNDGDIIMGNTIDQNGDGKIDGKDILLNKDPFYCIKLLDDAIKKKTEVHLNKLVKELDELMKSNCSCGKCYHSQFLSPQTEIFGGVPCSFCKTYCKGCCGSSTGCTSPELDNEYQDYGGYKQYKYDPCDNRQKIKCKSQEIRQLISGVEPDNICYTVGFIERKAPYNLLTIQEGLKRLQDFKAYFTNAVGELKAAEIQTKEPWGARFTLAEFYKAQSEDNNNALTKEKYKNYDISRYCAEYTCVQWDEVNGEKVCIKGKLSNEKRVCKIGAANKESYFYDGDPATFYFNSSYNDKQKETNINSSQQNKCSIIEESANKEMYTGLIPIGETVDYTEAWGEEVANRIQAIVNEVKGIYDSGVAISSLSEDCNCHNCRNAASNCCSSPVCDCSSSGGCCPALSTTSCYYCVPQEIVCTVKEEDGSCSNQAMQPYIGCSSFCGNSPDIPQTQEPYWVCPYRNFCQLMKDIYLVQAIDDSCYHTTDNQEEQAKRNSYLGKIGYLQKMQKREQFLFDLAKVGEIKDDEVYEEAETVNLINTVCPDYLVPIDQYFSCDGSSNSKTVQNRFTLLQKLNLSRVKLNGCVVGYSYPNKEDMARAEVFSCPEGLDLMILSKLVILPGFPYPDTGKDGYWNCYPFNSPNLSASQKLSCYSNNGYSTDACKKITYEYMDNYYCCE